jgi:hypothetical protein
MHDRSISRPPAQFHAEAFGESTESQGTPEEHHVGNGKESPEINKGLATMRKVLASGHAVTLPPAQAVKESAPDDGALHMAAEGLRRIQEEADPSLSFSGNSLGHAPGPQLPVFVPQHADSRSVIELSAEDESPDKKVACARAGERRNKKETNGCFSFRKPKAAGSTDPGGLGLVFRTYKSKTKYDTKRHAVVEIHEGGPAESGGVCVGDVIRRINGVSTDNLGTAEMSLLLKSASSLRLSRHGKMLDVSITSAGGGQQPLGRKGSVRVEAETGFVAGGGGSKVVTSPSL